MPVPFRWAKDELLRFLRYYEKRHGYVRSHDLDRSLVKGREGIRHAARRIFGTFSKAKVAAGIRLRGSWDVKRLAKEIHALRDQGHALTHEEARRRSPALVSAARRHAGSWRSALEKVGIEDVPPLPRYRQSWKFTSNAIIESIRTEWQLRGDVRVRSLRRRYGVGIYQAAIKKWGSWPKALTQAGVPALVAESRMAAAHAATGRVRVGARLPIPCRRCSSAVGRTSLLHGKSKLRCKACGGETSVAVRYGLVGWEVRTS